jgi:hypothetical protein
MKITAIIPDELVDEVKQLTQGKNITDSLIKACYSKKILAPIPLERQIESDCC